MSKSLRKEPQVRFDDNEVHIMISAAERASTRFDQNVSSDKMKPGNKVIDEPLTGFLGGGMLNTWNQVGYSAAHVSSQIHQLSQVREILELAAIRLCITSATKDQISML